MSIPTTNVDHFIQQIREQCTKLELSGQAETSHAIRLLLDRIRPKPKLVNGFPRRNRVDLFAPAEKAIYEAVGVVESAGAHIWLTDAVNLLQAAREKVADFVEIDPPSGDGGDDKGL